MEEKKGVLKRAINDMKKNAKAQYEIDKENFEAIKAANNARFEEAKKTNPDFQEFKDAKGLKAKAKVVLEHAERDGKKQAEENREKHKKLLEEQREKMNKEI